MIFMHSVYFKCIIIIVVIAVLVYFNWDTLLLWAMALFWRMRLQAVSPPKKWPKSNLFFKCGIDLIYIISILYAHIVTASVFEEISKEIAKKWLNNVLFYSKLKCIMWHIVKVSAARVTTIRQASLTVRCVQMTGLPAYSHYNAGMVITLGICLHLGAGHPGHQFCGAYFVHAGQFSSMICSNYVIYSIGHIENIVWTA